MEYQGRSPLKDVVRSVVISAGMIAPATMLNCSGKSGNENPPPDNGNSSGGTQMDDAGTGSSSMASGSDAGAMSDAGDAGDASDAGGSTDSGTTQAPPRQVVRPRGGNDGRDMPTRGFAGGRRRA